MRNRILMISFLVVFSYLSAIAPGPVAAGSTPVPGEVALRRALGLRTDPVYIASVHADPATSSNELGIPLTKTEATEIAKRGSLQDPISDYKQSFETREGFAGFYVDQPAGGVLVIMVTAAGRASADTWAASRPAGTTVRIETVSRTYLALGQLAASVDQDRAKLSALGVDLNSVRVDVPTNTVIAAAHPLNPSIERSVHALYPDLVLVDEPAAETATCVSRSNCGSPLKAGLWVTFSGGNGCTSNFVARHSASTLDVYLITAGHCALLSEHAYHNGVQIGNVVRRNWQQGGFTDSLAIDVAESAKSNLMYLTNSDTISITSRQPPTADYTGQIICQSGAVSTIRCGTIGSTNETQNFGGVILYHVRRVNGMLVQGGDSGAPTSVYQTGTATGLVMGSDYDPSNPIGWCTHVYWSEYFLNLSISKSMSCPL